MLRAQSEVLGIGMMLAFSQVLGTDSCVMHMLNRCEMIFFREGSQCFQYSLGILDSPAALLLGEWSMNSVTCSSEI